MRGDKIDKLILVARRSFLICENCIPFYTDIAYHTLELYNTVMNSYYISRIFMHDVLDAFSTRRKVTNHIIFFEERMFSENKSNVKMYETKAKDEC